MSLRKSWMWMILCLLAMLPVSPIQAVAGTAHAGAAATAAGMQAFSNRVEYHKQSDTLDVQAKNASLKSLLRAISLQSGVRIQMDPATNRPMTITLKNVPLDVALKRLARGLNYSFVYDGGRNHAKTPLLVSMNILPSGKLDSRYLQPVVTPLQAAMQHVDDHGAGGLSDKRWQALLDKLPAARREALEKAAAKRKKQQARVNAERKAQIQMIRKNGQAAMKRRDAMMNKLKTSDPALYRMRLQQQQQDLNQLTATQQQQQPAGK